MNKDITVKIMLLGPCNSGKTNILLRSTYEGFTQDYLSTIGVDFKMKKIP